MTKKPKTAKNRWSIKKIKHIYDPVFRQNFWYVCAPSHKIFLEIIKMAGMPPSQHKEYTEGEMAVYIKNAMPVITIWTKNKKPDILAHEICHAVSYSLRHKGLPLSDDTEETYCYLTQFLMKEILGATR